MNWVVQAVGRLAGCNPVLFGGWEFESLTTHKILLYANWNKQTRLSIWTSKDVCGFEPRRQYKGKLYRRGSGTDCKSVVFNDSGGSTPSFPTKLARFDQMAQVAALSLLQKVNLSQGFESPTEYLHQYQNIFWNNIDFLLVHNCSRSRFFFYIPNISVFL